MFFKRIIAFSCISAEGEARLEAHFVDHRFDGLVNVTDHAKSNASRVLSQRITQSIDVLAAQPGFCCDFLKRGACAHPELAVARIRVELLRGTRGAGLEEKHGLVATGGERLQNDHGIGFAFLAQTRQVRESRVRAETVGAVVRADLVGARRDDEAFAGERLARCYGARGKIIGDGCSRDPCIGTGTPV